MTARRCADAYWTELTDRIQTAADSGNIRAMYEGINIATGKLTKKTAPLKSKTRNVITEKKERMDSWVEHYLDLYSKREEYQSGSIGLPL